MLNYLIFTFLNSSVAFYDDVKYNSDKIINLSYFVTLISSSTLTVHTVGLNDFIFLFFYSLLSRLYRKSKSTVSCNVAIAAHYHQTAS